MQATPAHAPEGGARALAIATVLLVNAIPPLGMLLFGWSGPNLLVLYWIENLLLAFATSTLISCHATLTRKRGHQRAQLGLRVNDKPFSGGFGAEYRTAALAFTLAHGVFVAMVVFGFGRTQAGDPMWQLQPRELLSGALAIAALVALELWSGLRRIGSRSFAWIRAHAQTRLGRVVVLHLALILGIWALIFFDLPLVLLLVLAGLKLLYELGAILGRRTAESPRLPPRWLLAVADTVGRDTGGAEAIRRRWQAGQQKLARQLEDDERPLPP